MIFGGNDSIWNISQDQVGIVGLFGEWCGSFPTLSFQSLLGGSDSRYCQLLQFYHISMCTWLCMRVVCKRFLTWFSKQFSEQFWHVCRACFQCLRGCLLLAAMMLVSEVKTGHVVSTQPKLFPIKGIGPTIYREQTEIMLPKLSLRDLGMI